ncbi:unnamed protein product [Dovyalis caffra]|uniref:PRC-barrel domain-containing protein n=1 Tax=Dovyalis caffra TaxID=77055 RepID=A0AAV1S046_9ROSI|nr:unnamed protein product [Dovyalis caffra]
MMQDLNPADYLKQASLTAGVVGACWLLADWMDFGAKEIGDGSVVGICRDENILGFVMKGKNPSELGFKEKENNFELESSRIQKDLESELGSFDFDILELKDGERKGKEKQDLAAVEDGTKVEKERKQTRNGRRGKQVIKRSSILAKQVISIQSALSLGFVSQIWVDAKSLVINQTSRVSLTSTSDDDEDLQPSSASPRILMTKDYSVEGGLLIFLVACSLAQDIQSASATDLKPIETQELEANSLNCCSKLSMNQSINSDPEINTLLSDFCVVGKRAPSGNSPGKLSRENTEDSISIEAVETWISFWIVWVVLVVEVRPNLLSGESERFLLEDVSQVGDVVLVEDENVMDNELKMIGLETLVGYRVVTPGQRDIGKVRGYSFNINSGAVESLELDSFGISIIPSSLVSTYALRVEDVLEVLSDTVVVHESAASHIQRLTKGFWDAQNVGIKIDDGEEYADYESSVTSHRDQSTRRSSRSRKFRPKIREREDDWELPMDYL